MKKIRYIPYGYTIRDGTTVVHPEEADVIRMIFEHYIRGASLKEIAEELTLRRIPYTEKTATWDKARIARIIDNQLHTIAGNESYCLLPVQRRHCLKRLRLRLRNYQYQNRCAAT